MSLSRSLLLLAALPAILIFRAAAAPPRGAAVPWTTYEAEDMVKSGASVLGPPGLARDKNNHLPQTVDMEASGRRCVQLNQPGAYVEFTAKADASAIVVRYSLPDSPDGAGLDSHLDLSVNGGAAATLPVTSKYSWRYGGYPFANDPAKGNPRNFFDEVRLKDLAIHANDTVRLTRTDAQTACVIDLVDLEKIAAPLAAPANALDVTSPSLGADPTGAKDSTEAFRKGIAVAQQAAKTLWLPAGNYLISGDLNLPPNLTMQGAGMWHTTLIGDPAKYNLPKGGDHQRVRLNGGGDNIHLADFAIVGRLNYRNDGEANDGLGETFGSGSTIARLWVEHTKTGAWVANSTGLLIEDCRFRNGLADGVNLCVGVRSSTLRNCTGRGNGDDCFAIWPATYAPQKYAPGLNVIEHCTGSLSSLGNGAAIYGGESNSIHDCVFQDIPFGCGLLVAGTFPIGDNHFSGTTVVERCDVLRCGGFDSGWNAWRGAVTICPQNNDLTGLIMRDLAISDSLSYAIQFANPGDQKTLAKATLENIAISKFGLAVPHASKTPYGDGVQAIAARARGAVTLRQLRIDGTPLADPAPPEVLANATPKEFAIAIAPK